MYGHMLSERRDAVKNGGMEAMAAVPPEAYIWSNLATCSSHTCPHLPTTPAVKANGTLQGKISLAA